MKPAASIRILLFLLAAALSACFESGKPRRVAGGDDYPNGMEPLGKKAAKARADSADWNGFDSLPRTAPGLYDTVHVPDTLPDTSRAGQGAPAPERAASHPDPLAAHAGLPAVGLADTGLIGPVTIPTEPLDTLTVRVLDTARGLVETVRIQVDDSGRTRVDSTVFFPADPARPGSGGGLSLVVRRVVSADSGRIGEWRFLDADGDGLLSPRPGGDNLAAIVSSATLPGGGVRIQTRVLAAGADLDFNAVGDNRLLAGASVTVADGDTLELIRLLDADGDSAIIDFSKDTNLVDLVEERRFSESSGLVSVIREIRLAVFSDSSRNHPLRFTGRRVFRDGAVLDVAARGLAADSVFRPGTEASWTETRFPAPGDEVTRASRAWKVRLGPVAGGFGANLLLGFTVEETYRAGGGFRFDFRCATPVPDNRWVGDGDVAAWLALAGGERVFFAGAADSLGMRGQVTGPDGEGASIAFDRDGEIVTPRSP